MQAEGYEIRAVADAGEIQSLRTLWHAWNWHPNVDMDFYQMLNEASVNNAKPFVLAVSRCGDLHGLVVGRLSTEPFRCSAGYWNVGLGQVRHLYVLHGGILGCLDQDASDLVARELTARLAVGEADVVVFNHLNTSTALFRSVGERVPRLCRDLLAKRQPHWRARLPATSAAFLQRLNKKHRYWLRRLEKLIETDFAGQVSFRKLAGPQELNDFMACMEEIASKTYQRRLGAGFRNDMENRCRLAFEAERGWLRAYLLYLRGRPVAFWVGRVYKNIFFSDTTGYDPEYRKYELGTVVFMRMVDELCREGVEAIDFGLGDAQYKQRFGDESWDEAVVRIFSPRLRGIALNAAQTCIEGPVVCLRSLLRRSDLQQRLKTLWRKRLLKKSAN